MRRKMYLERLLLILEAVAKAPDARGPSVSDLVALTGLPKPSVYRQVNDLVETGLLEAAEGGRYVIGLRTKRLAGVVPSEQTIQRLAVPLLKMAAQDHGTTFFLSRLSGSTVEIVLAEVPGTGVSFLHPGIGARPLHACSCAKVIAAFSKSDTLLAAMKGRLRSYTDHTKTKLGDLEREFEDIRQIGFAECVEELEDGVCSVAAPVVINGDQVLYSLGATGTKRVLTSTNRSKLGEVTKGLCRNLAVMIEAPQVAAS